MNEQEKLLWEKIQNFQFDDPDVVFKFSHRLAKENGWSREYTARVLEEYKRFLFLCCITPTGVTPSDPVDQAWHLHLTFTKSYWIDLCKNTLGKDIHHNPTKGGKREGHKFNLFYTNTAKLYKEKFGNDQPEDIWHDNKTRFSDIHFQRVNVSKYWLVKKPNFKKLLNTIKLPFLLLLPIIFNGCVTDEKTGETEISIWFWVLVVVAIIFIIWLISRNNRRNGGSSSSGGSSSGGGCGFFIFGCSSGSSGCGSSGCGSSGCGGGGCGGGGCGS